MLRLLLLETRLLFRERLAWVALAVAMLACILAATQGHATLAMEEKVRQAFSADQESNQQDILKSIRESDVATAPMLPRQVSLPIGAPIPRLADFTPGRARFESLSTWGRLSQREDTLFKRPRLENPELLARGGVDLSFVAVVVLPLLLIALGYGIFAADRDSGVARLALVHQSSLRRLLIARSIPRFLLVLLPLIVTAAWLLARGPDLPGRWGAAAWWLLLAVLLLGFWWSLVLLVNSLRVSAESAAFLLVGLWAGFTLILPTLTSAVAQAANPPPSRFELVADARAAELRASSDFENDHPELTDEAAERNRQARRSVEINRSVAAALRPISARFEEQRERQQQFVRLLAFLSPASVAVDGQAQAAGTDGRTWFDFRRAARDYLRPLNEALSAMLLGGPPLTEQSYRSLPRFDWSPPAPRPLVPALYLALLTAAIGAVAARRFRRAELG